MTKSKTVLVTGANGFVGRETTSQLQRDGWIVLATGRHPADNEMIKLDLECPETWSSLSRLPAVDAIVHLAAKVDFSVNSLSDIYRANVLSTGVIADFARQCGAYLVFASTALVPDSRVNQYGSPLRGQFNFPYVESKWLSEQLIKASGAKHSILRIGGVFGLAGPEHLGLNRAIRTVVSGKRPVQIGNCDAKRSYLYVKDLAAVISEVMDKEIEGTHLVAGTKAISIAEMLHTLCDVFHVEQGPDRVDGASVDDQIIIPSSSLSPTRSFRDAAEDMYQSVTR